MRHFTLNKTQQRIVRIQTIINQLRLLTVADKLDTLRSLPIANRLTSAIRYLKSRHHKRANVQLTMALALMKGL